MPIYEYRCTACKHQLEAIQKFSDAPLVVCPKCGHETLTKLVSAAGFQLKGSGWYQTDFRGSGAKPAAKTEGEASKSGDAAKADSGGATDAKSTSTEKSSATPSTAKADKPAVTAPGSSPAT